MTRPLRAPGVSAGSGGDYDATRPASGSPDARKAVRQVPVGAAPLQPQQRGAADGLQVRGTGRSAGDLRNGCSARSLTVFYNVPNHCI